MSKTVYEVLEERIRGHIQDVADALVRGAAMDYPAYKELCGASRGLVTALKEVQDLSRGHRENDDDD